MPIKIRDKRTNEIVEVDWNGPGDPTPDQIPGLVAAAKLKAPVPLIPKPSGLLPPTVAAPPRPPDWQDAVQSIRNSPLGQAVTQPFVQPGSTTHRALEAYAQPGLNDSVRGAMLKGFITGAAEHENPINAFSEAMALAGTGAVPLLAKAGAIAPAVAARAKGVASLLADIGFGLQGAGQATDRSLPLWQRAVGGAQAVAPALIGAVGTGRAIFRPQTTGYSGEIPKEAGVVVSAGPYSIAPKGANPGAVPINATRLMDEPVITTPGMEGPPPPITLGTQPTLHPDTVPSPRAAARVAREQAAAARQAAAEQAEFERVMAAAAQTQASRIAKTRAAEAVRLANARKASRIMQKVETGNLDPTINKAVGIAKGNVAAEDLAADAGIDLSTPPTPPKAPGVTQPKPEATATAAPGGTPPPDDFSDVLGFKPPATSKPPTPAPVAAPAPSSTPAEPFNAPRVVGPPPMKQPPPSETRMAELKAKFGGTGTVAPAAPVEPPTPITNAPAPAGEWTLTPEQIAAELEQLRLAKAGGVQPAAAPEPAAVIPTLAGGDTPPTAGAWVGEELARLEAIKAAQASQAPARSPNAIAAAAAGPPPPPGPADTLVPAAPPAAAAAAPENAARKMGRIDEFLRTNPALAETLSGTSGPERAALYREIAGRRAEWAKTNAGEPPAEVVQTWIDQLRAPKPAAEAAPVTGPTITTEPPRSGTPPAASGGGDTTLYSGIDPTLLARYMASPVVRGLLGGTIGSQVDEQQPWRGAALGAAAGIAIPTSMANPTAGLKLLDKLRYEGALLGAPQITNILGNIGSLAFTPASLALSGDVAAARRLLRFYRNPARVARTGLEGLKAGWAEAPTAGMARFQAPDIAPIIPGPMGRTLHAVDAATKRILTEGGLTAEQAAKYTYSGDPVTRLGGGAAFAQSSLPGRLMSPFARTGINLLELGAAHSPLRSPLPGAITGGVIGSQIDDAHPVRNALVGAGLGAAVGAAGTNLRALIPTQGATAGRRAVSELMTAAPSVMAEEAGRRGYGPDNPTTAALFGPYAAPYLIGRGIHDYKQYGRESAGDVMSAILQQYPFLGDIPKMATDPSRAFANTAAMPIPQIGMVVGDNGIPFVDTSNTARDPYDPSMSFMDNIGRAIQAKIPIVRNGLPPRVDFFGHPEQRNWMGQIQPPLYMRDPRAAALAEVGALRRSPSTSYHADLTPEEKADLQLARGAMNERFLTTAPVGAATQTTPAQAAIDTYLATMPPEEAAAARTLISEMIPAGSASQESILKLLQRLATEAGTQQFQAERLRKASEALQR